MNYNNNNGPWLGRYTGWGSSYPSKPYNDWKFYKNDESLLSCKGGKECNTGEGEWLRLINAQKNNRI